MRYLIADAFTKSVARLDARTRAAVKSAAFDLLTQPEGGGLSRRQHRLVHPKGTAFWSVRVSRDLRMIVLRTGEEVVLCHVDHHDDAYTWAEQRRIDPRTAHSGAIVETAGRLLDAIGPQRAGFTAHAPEQVESEQGEAAPGPVEAELPEEPEAQAEEAHEPTARHRVPRRLRMRHRAAAPLPASSARPVSAGAAPPLAELLRLVRGASAPLTAPSVAPPASPPGRRELPMRAAGSRRAALVGTRGLIVAAAAMAATSALACMAARDLPLRAAGCAAAVAAALLALVAARRMSSASRKTLAAMTALRDAIRAGRLEARADPAELGCEWRALIRSLNETVDAFAGPFCSMGVTLTSLARGDVAPRAPERFQGDFERQRAAVDALVEFVMLRPEDIRALVARDHPPARARTPR